MISVSCGPMLLADPEGARRCGRQPPTTRARYGRDDLVYASDTRDAEWAQIAPLLPPPCRLGRPRARDLREIVHAILYVLWTGCQWRALPQGFPPRATVQRYFYRWRDYGTWARITQVLVAPARR